MCRPHARTVAAEGGHNNEVGLPLTLTRIEPDTEVVVCEMGMRGLGQITELCAVAKPDVGVITSIGPVHLELLETVENVAKAKAEVVAALPSGGTAVVPDEPLLAPYLTATTSRSAASGTERRVVRGRPRAAVEPLLLDGSASSSSSRSRRGTRLRTRPQPCSRCRRSGSRSREGERRCRALALARRGIAAARAAAC